MTRHNAVAVVVVVSLAAIPAHAAESQRRRVEAPPADAADAGEARKAVPREERHAEPRPAPPPAAEAAPKPTIETSAAKNDSPKGPVVVTPTVVVPPSAGGVTTGAAFSVGGFFSIGHDSPPPAVDTAPSSGRSRRHDRSHDEPIAETVFVPVAVPVYVPVASGSDETVLVDEGAISEDLPANAARTTGSSARTRRSRGYLTFSPWYYVGLSLEAGYPVPLPPPETFTEGNVSSTVAETERTPDGSRDNISVVGYAKDVGGIAFMVKPVDAAVYVDGRFVGSVRDYAPEHEPLLLRFGVYTVELRAKGYATERFSAYVTLGEVIPFSGSMTKTIGDTASDQERRQETGDRLTPSR